MKSQGNVSRGKKMTRDFLVYSVGVIGSKLMTFIMLPVYTHFISDPAEYGYFDLCLTLCFMLMPIVTLQMRDGAFRFLLETEESERRKRIVTFVGKTLFTSTMLTLFVAVCVWLIYPRPYMGYVVVMLIAMSFMDVYAQTVRGVGNNRSFVLLNILCSFLIAILAIIFLLTGMGIKGLFLSNILARIIALAVVESRERVVVRYFKLSLRDVKAVGREILRFSLPLLPAGLCFSFIGFSNRYIIAHELSLFDTGIYSLASRLAAVVQAMALIFLQTWQENAIQQYDKPARSKFFSQMFNGYVVMFSLVIIVYVFSVKYLFGLLFNASYSESLAYLFPMCVVTMLSSLSSYFEIIYQCEKNTRRLLPPLIAAPVVSVLLSLLLIGRLGIHGVIISYGVTYLLLTIYRWIDTRRWVAVTMSPASIIPVLCIAAIGIPSFFHLPLWLELSIFVSAFVVIVSVGLRPLLKQRI